MIAGIAAKPGRFGRELKRTVANNRELPRHPHRNVGQILLNMTPAWEEWVALREALVDALVRDGHVRSSAVAAAMRTVPRHAFIPEMPLVDAYENKGIPVADAGGKDVSSLSAPAWVATMLEELALEPGMRVLEVGAGTGYHAALLASLVGDEGRVVTVEIEPWLAERARTRLAELGFTHVKVVEGDGAQGAPNEAPFDRILLTTGTWEVFPAWLEQLAPGGRLLAPLIFGSADSGACVVVNLIRKGHHLAGQVVMGAEMVPMRGEIGGARGEQSSVAGMAWQPTPTSALRSVRVYPRSALVEPGINEKLFARGECQILLGR
jgi:methyltransferase of FxLD system